MVTSNLEQYSIADFLEWHEKNQLRLNPDFQRQSVWPPAARAYLIDTILRRLPIPKIYTRTSVDITTKRSMREVVDGQQRLRAIIDFSEDKFSLGPRAKEFEGSRYSTLSDEAKESFLTYQIGVDQLINASDEDVLEVFARLNSYTVSVNDPELRHAKFQSDFKWAIHESANEWRTLWDDIKVISSRDRIRLVSDSVMAEMFGVLLEGVRDGGQAKITKMYERFEKGTIFDQFEVRHKLDKVLDLLTNVFAPALIDTPLHGSPHFLMVFAASAHALFDIPKGELDIMKQGGQGIVDEQRCIMNLYQLGQLIEADVPYGNDSARAFWKASKSSTQRIASRKIRFPVYLDALTGDLPFE